MFLHIRNTWLLMIFTICFVTCFGIEFDEFWHRIWLNCGTPLASILVQFGIKSCLFTIVLVYDLLDSIVIVFLGKKTKTNLVQFFHHFFDPVPKRVFWDVPWLTLAPFRLRFCCFKYLFGSIVGALHNVFPCFSHRWFDDEYSIAFFLLILW